MPNPYYEIAALPVVAPLGALAFAVLLWRLHRGAAMTVPRVVVSAVMCVYGAGVIGNTLLPIYVGEDRYPEPWWVHLNLIPLVNTDPVDMLKNVAVFVPLGFLLPLIARVNSVRRVLLVGFLISFAMEMLQFVNAVTARGGHIADINDLLANTLGAPIGCGVFRVALLLLPALGQLARAATWPVPPQDEANTIEAPEGAFRRTNRSADHT